MDKNPFAKVCRLCLSTDVKLIAVLSKKSKKSKAEHQRWDKIILMLLEIQVTSKETLPKKICMMCSSVLQSFLHFRQKALDNDQKLRQLIKQMTEAQEPIEPESPELEYFPPFEYDTGDVVVIDPKREYSSADDGEWEDSGDEVQEVDQTETSTVCEGTEEPPQQTNDEEELTEIEIEVEPNLIESSTTVNDSAAGDEPKTLQPETNSLPPIMLKEPLQIGEFSEISNIINYQAEHALDVTQGTVSDVDEHVMQDIIDIIDEDIFAVLADSNCMDLDTMEDDELDDGSKHLDPVEVYICRICDAAFASQGQCNSHEFEHDPELPFVCTFCDKFKTSDRDACISHIKDTHNLPKPFCCFHCDKKFKTRTDLRKHAVRHAGLKTFVCAICNKNFSRRNNLKHHLKIHAGEKFGCTLCTKSFSTKHALQEHDDYHKNSDKYKCSLCGLLLTRKRRLVEHEEKCMKKNYQQNVPAELDPENVMVINLDPDLARTDMAFENDEVEDETGAIRYSCEICLKSFNNKRVLRHHKATHSGAKNHVCPFCERAFLRRNELERHKISVHQQIKKYECKTCQKSFSRKDKLLRHERTHTKTG